MKFSIQTWIIIGLAAIIVFLILTDRDPPAVDLTPYKTAIAIADTQIKELTAQNSTLLKKVSRDSIIQAEETSRFKTKISTLQRDMIKRRTRVDTLIVNNPELKAFVDVQDSIISFQSARIDSLEIDKAELRVDVKTITDNFLRQIEQHESKLKATEALADAYKKDARKSKRTNRWLKAGTVVLGVGGFLLGSSL